MVFRSSKALQCIKCRFFNVTYIRFHDQPIWPLLFHLSILPTAYSNTLICSSSSNCWSSLSAMYRHCCSLCFCQCHRLREVLCLPSATHKNMPYSFFLFFFLTSMLCFKLTYFPGSLSSSCFGWDHSPHCVHFSLCRLHYFIELYLFVAFSPFLHTHASIISLRAKTYVFLISVVSILALFWHTYPQQVSSVTQLNDSWTESTSWT